MYESIRGILKEKSPNTAIVECGGIGYRLHIPLSTYGRLGEVEKEVLLYLSHIVREDAHTLYGFLRKEERGLFELLLSVSGIGPKTAAGIIGHMEVSALKSAVAASDIRLLSKIPGIGKKTAERLVIEMRDKFKMKTEGISEISAESSVERDAISALMNLGYPITEAQKAVKKAMNESKESLDLSRLISLSLRMV